MNHHGVRTSEKAWSCSTEVENSASSDPQGISCPAPTTASCSGSPRSRHPPHPPAPPVPHSADRAQPSSTGPSSEGGASPVPAARSKERTASSPHRKFAAQSQTALPSSMSRDNGSLQEKSKAPDIGPPPLPRKESSNDLARGAWRRPSLSTPPILPTATSRHGEDGKRSVPHPLTLPTVGPAPRSSKPGKTECSSTSSKSSPPTITVSGEASLIPDALAYITALTTLFMDAMTGKQDLVEEMLCSAVLTAARKMAFQQQQLQEEHHIRQEEQEKLPLEAQQRRIYELSQQNKQLKEEILQLRRSTAPRRQRLKEAQEGLVWLITMESEPDPAAVEYCVQNGADVNIHVALLSVSVFFHFVSAGNVDCVRACTVSANPLDFTESDDNGCTVLHEAVRLQPLATAEAMTKLLAKRMKQHPEEDKVDWEQRDNGGRDVFTWAAHCQRLSVIWPLVCDLEFFKNRTEPIPLYLTVTKDDWEKLGEENQKRFWTQSISS